MTRFYGGELSPMEKLREKTRRNSVTTVTPSGTYTRKLGSSQGGWGMTPSAPELPEEVAGGMESMVREYNRAYGEARAANEARYAEMLRISRGETQRQAGTQEEMLGLVGQTSGQRAADIRSDWARQRSDAMQKLARQGMAGTTIAPTLQMGYKREEQSALNRLADLMQERKLEVMRGIAAPRRKDELGIMERRTDEYPEMEALTETMRDIGSGYGTSGTTAMVGALSGMRMG